MDASQQRRRSYPEAVSRDRVTTPADRERVIAQRHAANMDDGKNCDGTPLHSEEQDRLDDKQPLTTRALSQIGSHRGALKSRAAATASFNSSSK